jgi:hypothetical protein
LSSSSYDGACSALNHLFIESFIEKDANVVTKDFHIVWYDTVPSLAT